MTPVRVTGTTDPAEIAAVLAAVSSARAEQPQQGAYERWRRARVTALRRTLNNG
ncbi:MAG TPA: hypothetical protein VFE19_10305 [Jatrophihabitantaceae bacterium]|nr:hypothetical protein [Jatrophihabitantaceae bacterium]